MALWVYPPPIGCPPPYVLLGIHASGFIGLHRGKNQTQPYQGCRQILIAFIFRDVAVIIVGGTDTVRTPLTVRLSIHNVVDQGTDATTTTWPLVSGRFASEFHSSLEVFVSNLKIMTRQPLPQSVFDFRN